jgi:drug/metabolite transporter (DMT)-like permease
MTKAENPILLAWLSLAAICIIWGTTYTAIKFSLSEFSPFLMAGIRQTAAGAILLAGAYVFGLWQAMSRKYLTQQAVAGAMMIAGGNGFITWGMQYVSSGLSAVIGSLTPIMVVILSLFWAGREKMHWLMALGVFVGFAGLSLIFKDGWKDFANPDYRWGIFGCFASCFTWSLGTVLAKRHNDTSFSPVLNAGLQVFSGGVVLFCMSFFLDTNPHLGTSWQTWASLLYLILIGSALAFSLYTFILKHLDATVSSLYTYINPIVAILTGWFFLHEKLSWTEVLGMLITILGVYLVNRGSALAKT